MGGFCPGGFCPRGILSGGFCPGGFCPRTIANKPILRAQKIIINIYNMVTTHPALLSNNLISWLIIGQDGAIQPEGFSC